MDNVSEVEALPSGNELLKKEDTFTDLCNAMLLHRDVAAQKLLQKALSQLYAESFDRQRSDTLPPL